MSYIVILMSFQTISSINYGLGDTVSVSVTFTLCVGIVTKKLLPIYRVKYRVRAEKDVARSKLLRISETAFLDT